MIRTPVSVSSEAGILPGATLLPPQNAVNQIFDYASFMWEGGEAWQQVAAGAGESVEFDGQLMVRRFGHGNHRKQPLTLPGRRV